ncbi:uncharacterized protein LOC124155940 [Ischnura elegans]|uniref:uncharacterized protein LOC124155940 n=1 Tax=Ischnura elegans TaxID=197161 RepID=UPI001ED8A54E|nr:uncharacterized protein LOC124155940 [Ischnura elegans]
MTLLRIIAKTLILCLLGSAALCKGETSELNRIPKNIIVLLAGGLTSDGTIDEDGDSIKNGSESNDHPNPSDMFVKENMPVNGIIMPKNIRQNGTGDYWKLLEIIFNGFDAEGNGNGSTSESQTNIMSIAHKAGKLTGLISTVDVTSEIPATIYGAHLGSSYSNCSNSDQLISMNVILGQAPIDSMKEKNIWKCLSNHAPHANPNSLMQELEKGSKEHKRNVLGLFPKVGPKDLKAITSAAFQLLQRNEKGFFLAVVISGEDAETNMKMVTRFLEKLLPSDLVRETLVVAALVGERASKSNISPANGIYGVELQPVVENNQLINASRKRVPPKEIETSPKRTEEHSIQKTIQETGEDNLVHTKPQSNSKGEDNDEGNQTVVITETSNVEPVSKLSLDSYENQSTGVMSIQLLVNVNTTSYSPTGPTLETEFEMHGDVQTSPTPLPTSEVTSSLSVQTTVIVNEKNAYSSDFLEDHVLSTAGSVLEEEKVRQNEMEENVENSIRKKRETGQNKSQGIPLFASGPGSKPFNGTLSPHDVRRLFEIYISFSCENANFTELKELSMANCSDWAELSDISALSSTSVVRIKQIIFLAIVIGYTLLIY